MSGRAATVNVIPGAYALSVGRSDLPSPPGWRWVPLTDIARLESGHTPSRQRPEYWDGDIPWIGIKDARAHHGGIIEKTLQTVTQEGIDNSAARILPAGTVCLSRTASVGYVVVMGRKMATSQDFVNWVCGEALAPAFLQHLLVAENESLFRFGKGSTHTTIYYPEVKAFHICLPPLNEQYRIVAKLELLQGRSRRVREALDTVPPLLEKLRQSILAAAFRGDLTKEWRAKHKDVEPASELLKRIRVVRRKKWEESELAKMKAKGKAPTDDRWKVKYKEPERADMRDLPALPQGWCWTTVEELASDEPRAIQSGPFGSNLLHSEFQSTGVLAIGIDNVQNGAFSMGAEHRISEAKFLELMKYAARPGDVLVTVMATVGRCCTVPEDLERAIITKHVYRISPNYSLVLPNFLMHSLQGASVLRAALTADMRGQTRPGINGEILRSLPVALAPLEEQKAVIASIGSALRASQRLLGLQARASSELTRLEKSILAKAFRGELVPQDPNDEPAAAMLERVNAANGRTARALNTKVGKQLPRALRAETEGVIDTLRRSTLSLMDGKITTSESRRERH